MATATASGLTTEEAARRLAEHGPNEPIPAVHASALLALLGRLLNPLVIILLIAAGFSAFLGELIDAIIIVVMVLVGVLIDFAQTYRSQQAAERLRDQVTITATVLRDGQWRELPRREVAPGDVVRLTPGDLVPADGRLIEALELHLHEAALTGESLPTEKAVGEPVYLGTSVVSGSGIAEATATGSATQFGGIAKSLAARPQATAFERGLHDFGSLILRMVFFLVLFVVLVGVIEHHPPFESLLFAISLAVGLTPEFLPMITSVTLAKGAIQMARQKVIVKRLAAIQNFGSIDILCSDKTGTLTSGEMTVESSVDGLGKPSPLPLTLAAVNSGLQTGIRSPLDTAILNKQPSGLEGYVKQDEIPFDFERRRVSVIVAHAGKRMLITKGAAEHVLNVVTNPTPEMKAASDELQAQGFRVLAVAFKEIEPKPHCTIADECDLTLAGFLAFSDPPLAGAHDTLEELRRDGIEVKILTGDNEKVAQHVCAAVGLASKGCITGDEIERMGDSALDYTAEHTTIFARVAPAQKNRILISLRRRGHIVGYLGDGINDAPSLRAADVGISVASAVDVARDAADIILLQPGLDILHAGVIEGRKAFGNVMKYLLMGTSSNFGNMLSMAAASAFLPFLPMLPTQILLNNLLYDLAQVTIPTDLVDESFLRKPQRWDIKLVRNFMLAIGPISSLYDFLTFYALLHFFHANEAFFHTGWFVESLATQTLVLFVIRTMQNPFASRPSVALAATTVGIVVIGVALPYTPLAGPLGFVPLPGSFLAFVAGASVTYLALVEVVKRLLFAPKTMPAAQR
jgi:Mg2+-importing ATPase